MSEWVRQSFCFFYTTNSLVFVINPSSIFIFIFSLGRNIKSLPSLYIFHYFCLFTLGTQDVDFTYFIHVRVPSLVSQDEPFESFTTFLSRYKTLYLVHVSLPSFPKICLFVRVFFVRTLLSRLLPMVLLRHFHLVSVSLTLPLYFTLLVRFGVLYPVWSHTWMG